MTEVTLLSDAMSDATMLAELKSSQEKWHKDEFDVGQNEKVGYYII